jgi:Xaa-Pro aminopeptidase
MTPRQHAGALPAAELERRWTAVRRYLRDHRADALVATASQDYLGGYYRWLTDRPAYHGYGAAVVFHADAPMTVIDHGELGGMRILEGNAEYPGVGRVRSTAAFQSANFTHRYEADLILEELRSMDCKRVAVLSLDAMPHSIAAMLQSGGFALLDATDWLDGVKAIKSKDELAAIREVAALQDRVFARTLEHLRPGMRERDVMAIVQQEATQLGSDQGVIITGSAKIGQPGMMRFPYYQERIIDAGDYMSVLIEVSGRSGYYCELGRIVSFGPAPDILTHGVAQSLAMQDAVLAAMRPGVAASDLAALHDENLRKRNLPPERRLFSHGQGYDLVERPLIRSDETMRIEAGMNFACHPAIVRPDLFCFVCDNHFVTDTGSTPVHATEQKVFEV